MSGSFSFARDTTLNQPTFTEVHGQQYNTTNVTNVDQTAEKEILAALKPVERSSYYVLPCMEGTRSSVFKEINDWLDDYGAPNILWLSGSPGAGKSAIASSLVSSLAEQGRLGSNFFFRRGDVTLSDPAALWRTVASDLGRFDSAVMASLTDDLRERRVDPERTDLSLHFKYMIKEPLTRTEALSRNKGRRKKHMEEMKRNEERWGKHEKESGRIEELREKHEEKSKRTEARLETLKEELKKIWELLNAKGILQKTEIEESHIKAKLTEIWKEWESIEVALRKITDSNEQEDVKVALIEIGDEWKDVEGSRKRITDEREDIEAALKEIGDEWKDLEISLEKIENERQGIMATLKKLADEGKDIEVALKKIDDDKNRLPLRHLVIVLDALDECGCDVSQIAQRKIIFETFTEWSNLCKEFKLVVTGRNDRVPNSFRTICRHIELLTGNVVNCEAADDVQFFLQKHLANVAESYPSLPCDWPGIATIERLTARAAGLFIWAETVVRFIEKGLADEQLELVLSGDLGDAADNIDRLYWQILEFHFKHETARILHAFNVIVGTIVRAKVPLHRDDIKHFLSTDIRETSIDFILGKLSSVISTGDQDGQVRISHLSFSEFLCDSKRCPERFSIDRRSRNQELALVCLQLMNDEREGLKFNICNLESSYVRNKGVHDLTTRIKNLIPTRLLYACRFWADHLRDAREETLHNRSARIGNPTTRASTLLYAYRLWMGLRDVRDEGDGYELLLPEMRNFFYGHLLYWLEVLSLIGQVPIASTAILTAARWIEALDEKLLEFARDASRFVAHFHIPIAESAPHIYLSALPFSPRDSMISKHFLPLFPRTLSVVRRGDHWPALVNVLVGHMNTVRSVGFSPDGKRVISGSFDRTIRVWDAKTGEIVGSPFRSHKDSVQSVQFSPDGKRVVSGSDDKTIRVWDGETGEMVGGPLYGHTDAIQSVQFSPDGSRIVSGSLDKTLRVWNADTGEIVACPFTGHKDSVHSVQFSPDGKRIVSGSLDKTIHVWDTETSEIVAGPFEGHTDHVNSVKFSPDGKRIVSGSSDKTICIWDAENGQVLAGPFKGHTESVQSVGFSPDGKCVVSGSADKTIRIWDVEPFRIVGGFFEGHTDEVISVEFSPDGKRIASGSRDKTICIWDTEMARDIPVELESHAENARSVGFSSDGNCLVAGSFNEKTIQVLDAKTGGIVAGPFEQPTHSIQSLGLSRDGKYILSGSKDAILRAWDAETGEIIAYPFEGHTDCVRSVGFSSDGKRIVSGSFDKTIRVWDVETGEIIAGPFDSQSGSVSSVAFSLDGQHIVSGSFDRTVRVWDAGTGMVVAGPFKGHSGSVRSVRFSPDGKHVVSGSFDKTIRVWDAKTGEIVAGPLYGHTDAIQSVQFSPDGMHIVSGSFDKTLRIWDARTGENVAGPFGGHTDYVRSVGFSPDGKHVLSGSDDKTIRLWDAVTGEIVAGPFIGHKDSVQSVQFSPDGKCIVSGSLDKTILVWDAETGEMITGPFEGHTDDVQSVIFSPDGRRILSGSDDATMRIWDAKTGEMMAGPFRHHTDYLLRIGCSKTWETLSGPFIDHIDTLLSIGGSRIYTSCCNNASNGWTFYNPDGNSDHFHSSHTLLLFWVPPSDRLNICGRETLLRKGKCIAQLDLSQFMHGTSWTQCKKIATSERNLVRNDTTTAYPQDVTKWWITSEVWYISAILLLLIVACYCHFMNYVI